MYKYFLCLLAILAFFMTIQSDIRSADDIYNEDEQLEQRYVNKKGKVWKVKQWGRDSEDYGKIKTAVSTMAVQTSVFTHFLWATAWFESSYRDPKVKGTWYLRARLNHDWATDNPPYEDCGLIKGKQKNISASGGQSDKDHWVVRDPLDTIKQCDSHAAAHSKVPLPGNLGKVEYHSVAYSYFTPQMGQMEFIHEDAP